MGRQRAGRVAGLALFFDGSWQGLVFFGPYREVVLGGRVAAGDLLEFSDSHVDLLPSTHNVDLDAADQSRFLKAAFDGKRATLVPLEDVEATVQ